MLIHHKDEGFISLVKKQVTVYCSAYIYTGILESVNDTCIKLSGTRIIYDTGKFLDKDWLAFDSFPNPGDWYIQLSAIESFGILKY